MQLSHVAASSSGSAPREDQVSGAHSGGVPPVPIPNTAVKPASADGSWTAGFFESRTVPGLIEGEPAASYQRASRFLCRPVGTLRCKRNALLEINHSHAQRSPEFSYKIP